MEAFSLTALEELNSTSNHMSLETDSSLVKPWMRFLGFDLVRVHVSYADISYSKYFSVF